LLKEEKKEGNDSGSKLKGVPERRKRKGGGLRSALALASILSIFDHQQGKEKEENEKGSFLRERGKKGKKEKILTSKAIATSFIITQS